MSAYVMTIRVNTRSDDGMEEYRRIAAGAPMDELELIADSRSGHFEVLEGPSRETAVILRFPTVEAARTWYFSDAYQAAVKERWKSGDFQSFLVEGTDHFAPQTHEQGAAEMDATAAHEPGYVVRRFYDLLAEGKAEEALDLVDETGLVVHESTALPYGGEYRGRAGMQDLLQRMAAYADASLLRPIDYLPMDGGRVLVRMAIRVTDRPSGRSIETEIAEVYAVTDGKITDVDVYYRDPAAVASVATG